jgi:hypothetical protein
VKPRRQRPPLQRLAVVSIAKVEQELADRIESMMNAGELADSPARRRELADVRKRVGKVLR